MFHRTVKKAPNNNGAQESQSTKNLGEQNNKRTYTPRVESSAVQRYAQYQNAPQQDQSIGHDIANNNQSMSSPVEMIDNSFEQPVETDYQTQTQFNNSVSYTHLTLPTKA